ncbi:zinc ribbon domain-containing protein [Leucobacter sp. M11]|uniref:zinc ribbon domain-containing protein n=1 Tax=Leucobacter sp. M11 TaxID=2993565 RepID=UPI002D8000D4|nr:C4-type zinc ribbon domain-containing protein [Leucobacter sp. M11]MEB4616134.1 hypothetical protein [Leucobacter sp. M11]
MKATPDQQALLLDLQDLDTRAARIARRRSQLPEREQITALSAETAGIRDRFMTAQRAVEETQVELDRLGSDVATVVARRSRNEQRLAASVSAKEAEALQSEIESLVNRAAELESLELAALEANETAQAQLDAANAEVTGQNERRQALEQALAAGEAALARELAETIEERKNLSVTIAGDVLALYEETRQRTGIGAARLRGKVSEGSNMALTDSEIAELRGAPANEIVFCPGSGAILVRLPEDAE